MATKKKTAIEEVQDASDVNEVTAYGTDEGHEVPSDSDAGDEVVENKEAEESAGTTDSGISAAQVIKPTLVISNPTNNIRALMLRASTLVIYPGEVKTVPDKDVDEVMALIKVVSVRKQFDAGLLRAAGLADEELIDPPTKGAPETLSTTVHVGDTSLQVGLESPLKSAGTYSL